MTVFHIVQDPALLPSLKKAFSGDDFLLWDDPLYEGPVPSVSLDQLANIRGKYLAQSGRGPYDNALAAFRYRNQSLRKFRKYNKVILWFDHNLSGQLQLTQVLNWFSQQTMGDTELRLVCTDRFPGVFKYQGLYMLKPKQLQLLGIHPAPVMQHQMDAASLFWAIFTSENPKDLQSLLATSFETLPYLKDALLRLLDEYPGSINGLSKTQQNIIMATNMGYHRVDTIYEILKRKEDRHFLSIASFLHAANQLSSAHEPAITAKKGKVLYEGRQARIEQKLSRMSLFITPVGKNVMFQHEDWIEHNGIDRWVGGVHISEGNIWRRSTSRRQLNRTYA